MAKNYEVKQKKTAEIKPTRKTKQIKPNQNKTK